MQFSSPGANLPDDPLALEMETHSKNGSTLPQGLYIEIVSPLTATTDMAPADAEVATELVMGQMSITSRAQLRLSNSTTTVESQTG